MDQWDRDKFMMQLILKKGGINDAEFRDLD